MNYGNVQMPVGLMTHPLPAPAGVYPTPVGGYPRPVPVPVPSARRPIPGLGQAPVYVGPGPYGQGQVPPHTASYKDTVQRAGIEFHTDPFDYIFRPTATQLPILNNTTISIPVQIVQDSDFVCEKLTHSVAPSVEPLASFEFLVIENGSSLNLANDFQTNQNGLGTAQRPRLWKPRLFRRNTTITIQVRNISGGNITFLLIVFHGYRIFDRASLNLNQPL